MTVKEQQIRVVVYPVMREPYVAFLDVGETLSGLQALVEGYIDRVAVEEGLDVWINDEGLINGMLPNRITTMGVLHGPMVLARVDREGETVSVTEADIAKYMNTWPLIYTEVEKTDD